MKQRSFFRLLLTALPDIRPEERILCSLFTLNLFILLTSYYLLKTVREALILGEAGAEIKSYTAAAQPFILILAAKGYSFVASRKHAAELVISVMLYFILVFLALGILSFFGVPVGVVYFLCLGPFTLIVVAQFWAYATDLLTLAEGKRLFPVINIGGVLGAWVGAVLASYLFRFLSAPTILVIACSGMSLHMAIYRVIAKAWRRGSSNELKDKVGLPLSREGAFRLLVSKKYYLLIAGVALLLNVSKSNGEFLFGFFASLQAKAAIAAGTAEGLTEQQLIGASYGKMFALVNVTGFLIQVLVVPWVFRFMGIRGTVLVLPCLAAMMSTATAIDPVFGVVLAARVLENSVDYSLQNTTVHGLFLPTSRDAKYKVQAVVDTRFGDLISAACVFLLINQLHLIPRQFALANTFVIACWLALAILLGRQYREIVESGENQGKPGRTRYSL
jgi:ATP:ADP antiporter, AAA family